MLYGKKNHRIKIFMLSKYLDMLGYVRHGISFILLEKGQVFKLLS